MKKENLKRVGDFYYYIGEGLFGFSLTKYKLSDCDETHNLWERVGVVDSYEKMRVFKSKEEAGEYLNKMQKDLRSNGNQ